MPSIWILQRHNKVSKMFIKSLQQLELLKYMVCSLKYAILHSKPPPSSHHAGRRLNWRNFEMAVTIRWLYKQPDHEGILDEKTAQNDLELVGTWTTSGSNSMSLCGRACFGQSHIMARFTHLHQKLKRSHDDLIVAIQKRPTDNFFKHPFLVFAVTLNCT